MKKAVLVLCASILLSSCLSFPRKAEIVWPEKIESLAAICELDMSWRDMKYSGSMSVKITYPDKLRLEVYGPFGETIVYLLKDEERFSFISGEERFNDLDKFEKKFGIRLSDFIEDMAIRRPLTSGPGGSYIKRETYAVVYELERSKDRMCWKGSDGSICVRFLEAVFNNE